MFVSPAFASKHKFNVKSAFQIIGGKLNKAKLVLIDPSEGDSDIDYNIDYKNIFGRKVNILDSLSNIFLQFDKGKLGNHGRRITMLVAGPSGAGKSTFCINYMNIFRLQMKKPDKYPIYFITSIVDDPRINKIENCTVIDLHDSEMINYYFIDPETKLDCNRDIFGNSNLNNSLVIIDDAESLDKSIRVILEELISNIMKYGRHNNCNLIWSRHSINNNNKLVQESLSELMYIVLFKDCAHRRLTYFCEKYLDYGKELVNWIRKDSGCRYTIVHNRSPFFVLNDKSIIALD